MNFRDYASRIRTQAQAAALKIPTFDDMAANDEYIHSEDFNVRGQTRDKLESSSSASTGNHSSAAAAGVGVGVGVGGVDPDETSSMGSWSLLDRPPAHLRSPGAIGSKDKLLEMSSIHGSLQGGMSTDTSVSSADARSATQRRPVPSSSPSSLPLPLFSAVANALEVNNTNRTQRDDSTNNTGVGRDLDDYSVESDGNQSDDDDDDDDDSMDSDLDDDEDDENDPIMSMIRKNKPPVKERRRRLRSSMQKSKKFIGSKTSAQKFKQRFLDDLDERVLSSAGDEQRMEAGLPSQPLTSNESSTQAPFVMKGPFGGWLQNAAKAQLDRVLRRPETFLGTSGISQQQKVQAKAPLTRERPQKSSKTTLSPADDFQRAASTSFMGDEEMAQLARLKDGSELGRCSNLAGLAREYRSFAFIIFTLVLAIFVYFFQRSADDVS